MDSDKGSQIPNREAYLNFKKKREPEKKSYINVFITSYIVRIEGDKIISISNHVQQCLQHT